MTISNDEELATMFARHKEKENFHVRLQTDVLEQAFGPRMAGATSRGETSRRNGISSQNSSVGARRRGGSTSVGNSSRVPLEVEPDGYNSGVDEEKLYSDVIQNLRRAPRAENQDEAHNAVRVDDDAMGEDEDLAAVEWDPLNPHMEESTVFVSMTECRNALVRYCIKVEHTFKVDKSNQVRYRVHCPTEGCPWRLLASKMRNSTNVEVKVNPFKHTCQESTHSNDTISRAKSRWVAEEVKKWVKETSKWVQRNCRRTSKTSSR